MNLRIKLTLFTVGFVLFASIAILVVAGIQIRQKGQRDIQIFRTNEMRRLYSNLQNSVNLICAVEDRIGKKEIPTNLEDILQKFKKNAGAINTDWIWVLDTGNTDKQVVLSNINDAHISTLPDISELVKAARKSEHANTGNSSIGAIQYDTLTMLQSHLYWYAQVITKSGWVLAVVAPLSNLDSAVAVRTTAVYADIARMIKDRMIFSLLLIIACAVAIFLFSKIISDPINRLVNLTESIADGRKGFSDRISVTSRNDEIGRLAASFNSLLKHVQDSMNKLEVTAVKYRELVENANSAIIHIDGSGTVLFINEHAQRLFGYIPSEVEGKNIAATIGKLVDGQISGSDMFAAPEKYPYLERKHFTSQGNHIWVGWTNRPIFDKDQNRIETLCVGSDITKSKEAEELAAFQQRKLVQADKMATLGILVSGVAHEINNPNNYIVLNAQSLYDMWRDIVPVLESYAKENPDYAISGLAFKELNKEIPGMLKGITDGALRIKSIVQNLKDFSRMEPDDMTQKVDISKVLDSAQTILSNMIKKSTYSFQTDIPTHLPMIRGNGQRLEQVIINLLANACQATDDPSKPVSVQVEYRQSSNEMAIVISDKGRGINPDDMKRIFDPFFTTKRDEGGTGLGLAVSYSIVKDHGGDLKLDSVVGKGTVATLTLPVV